MYGKNHNVTPTPTCLWYCAFRIASWACFLRNIWPNSINITFIMVSWTCTCIGFCFSLYRYNSLLKWKYWSVNVRIYWLSYNTSALLHLKYPIPKCCWHFSKEIVLDGVDGELKTGRIVCTPQSNFIGEETLTACTIYVVHVPGLKLLMVTNSISIELTLHRIHITETVGTYSFQMIHCIHLPLGNAWLAKIHNYSTILHVHGYPTRLLPVTVR